MEEREVVVVLFGVGVDEYIRGDNRVRDGRE